MKILNQHLQAHMRSEIALNHLPVTQAAMEVKRVLILLMMS